MHCKFCALASGQRAYSRSLTRLINTRTHLIQMQTTSVRVSLLKMTSIWCWPWFDLDLDVWPWLWYVTLTSLMACRSIQRNNKLKILNNHFFAHDLDLDPMTLILKLDLDMVKMYLHTKNEVPMWSGSKVIVWTDCHTDGQTDTTENINMV